MSERVDLIRAVRHLSDVIAAISTRVRRKTELRQGTVAAVEAGPPKVVTVDVGGGELVDAGVTAATSAVVADDVVWLLWVTDGTWLVIAAA